MASQPVHRYWIDYSKGLVLGNTLTLSSRNGALLVAGLSVLVTLAGSSFWTIVTFLWHRQRATNPESDVESERDLLFHQEQVILRNPPTPLPAAWDLFQARRSWASHTRNNSDRGRFECLVPLLIFIIFTAASVAVAFVATPNYRINNILLQPGSCGGVHIENSTASRQAFNEKVANDARIASAYVDQCYIAPSRSLNVRNLLYLDSDIHPISKLSVHFQIQTGVCLVEVVQPK